MGNRKGFSAWLVTWEWSGNHAEPPRKIVEILSPHLSPERVRHIVELLYHRDSLLAEKVAWRLRKRRQPYKAEFPAVDGVQWTGQIICGHNPWLLARLVDNLIVTTDSGGKETATWTERCSAREMGKRIRRFKS